MYSNENHIKSYNSVSEDIKFISNSLIRLKVLMSLIDEPKTMKGICDISDLTYSSVSNALNLLESKDIVYRKFNQYYLSNIIKLHLDDLVEFKITINLLEEIFNLIEGHIIDNIPKKSITELHLLEFSILLESSDVDAFKVYKFIEDALNGANFARCILPVYHTKFNKKLNDLVAKNKFVELKVNKKALKSYKKSSKVKYLSSFDEINNFLLIITDELMIFGLFREGGIFDQNRLLISFSPNSIKWANNLFSRFKKLHK